MGGGEVGEKEQSGSHTVERTRNEDGKAVGQADVSDLYCLLEPCDVWVLAATQGHIWVCGSTTARSVMMCVACINIKAMRMLGGWVPTYSHVDICGSRWPRGHTNLNDLPATEGHGDIQARAAAKVMSGPVV